MKIEKIIKKEIITIGRMRYNSLYSALIKLELEKEKGGHATELSLMFEKIHKITVRQAKEEVDKFDRKWNKRKNLSEKAKEYLRNIGKEKEVKTKEMTKEWLWKKFTLEYFNQNKVKYSMDESSIENIKPLIYYFIGDYENFKKCKNVSKLSKPSLNKGLLIIGGYGNGKTSVMKSLEKVLRKTNVSFVNYSANEVVTMYENCTNPAEKKEFNKNVEFGVRNFDDVLTERIASNYGKANIIKDILEERYNKGKRTYITLNYKDEYEDGKVIYNLENSLMQLGEKYGSRLYDRIFSMFNIIEFKGNSYRK